MQKACKNRPCESISLTPTLDDKFVSVQHHLAHAASAFYLSGYSDALILVADGMGEVHSLSVLEGSPSGLKILKQLPALHSLGILYGVFTHYLGFCMNFDEYKIMGLAPYGNPKKYFHQIMDMIRLKNDGLYSIPVLAQDKTVEEKETHDGVLQFLIEEFGPLREPESAIEQLHMDLAAALQAVLQQCQLHVLRHYRDQTGQTNLCMAGGVALNCTANGVIKRSKLFKHVFVQPAAGDDGTALGSALHIHREQTKSPRPTKMGLPLWGNEYPTKIVNKAILESSELRRVPCASFDGVVSLVAQGIAEGKIVAWFQGRMEFGPRALGSRSLLANPCDPLMRERINRLVKKREGFRPFAPAVLAEAAAQYFVIDRGDEETYSHMLYVTQVRKAFHDKLPAITHVDGSARVQTVFRTQRPRFWQLISKVGEITGVPMVLNTSFNVRGQPIVCSPKEAIETFLSAGLDMLVIGDTVLVPEQAPTAEETATAGASRTRT